MTLQSCPQPGDLATLMRPDLPRDIVQLIIIVNNVPMAQGRVYRGEVYVNTAAFSERADGNLVFMYKARDAKHMPARVADLIVEQLIALDPKLPTVKRGKEAVAIQGRMKTALERHSRNNG